VTAPDASSLSDGLPPAPRPLRVAVTGATGFLGRALLPLLRARGHAVLPVSRSGGEGAVRWDPGRGEIDARALVDVDAAIHLAGENVGQRWTADARRRILDSRVAGTSLLARTLASLAPRPATLVSMSGANYYGDTGDREVTEASPAGTGFLADVVRAWEAAADPARDAGLRVVHPRTGVVLHADGGALARMLPVFRLGAGGRVGSGRQWMSWIARDDAVRALVFLLEGAHDPAPLAGPVNVVAPAPATNERFTQTLAEVLHRPAPLVVPGFALELAYGEMARETLLTGQRIRCDRLLDAGFRFRHPTLEQALRAAVGG
jgi:uncharacterized protein (TIGR01777 family)